MMKLGYFQVLTRPQIGQDHAQRLSVERENQLGGGGKDWPGCLWWQMANGPTFILKSAPKCQTPYFCLREGQTINSGIMNSHSVPFSCVTLYSSLTVGTSLLGAQHSLNAAAYVRFDPPPDITHALFIFQNISKEISPFPAAVILLDCLKERQSFSHGKLMQTHGACKMTQNW